MGCVVNTGSVGIKYILSGEIYSDLFVLISIGMVFEKNHVNLFVLTL